jgi:hypothetical protein
LKRFIFIIYIGQRENKHTIRLQSDVEMESFPTPAVRVYNGASVWFIAYADDLDVIALSPVKLEDVLNKLNFSLSI